LIVPTSESFDFLILLILGSFSSFNLFFQLCQLIRDGWIWLFENSFPWHRFFASNITSCSSLAIISAFFSDFGPRAPSLDLDRFFRLSLNRSQSVVCQTYCLRSFAVLGILSLISTGLWSLVVHSRLIFHVPMSWLIWGDTRVTSMKDNPLLVSKVDPW